MVNLVFSNGLHVEDINNQTVKKSLAYLKNEILFCKNQVVLSQIVCFWVQFHQLRLNNKLFLIILILLKYLVINIFFSNGP